MNKLPPSIQNAYHPDDIIPYEFKNVFIAHFMATSKSLSVEDFQRDVSNVEIGNGSGSRKITTKERKHVAEIYQKLQENGWFPMGLKGEVGEPVEIVWAYRVSKPLDMLDLPKKMTPAQSKEYLNKQFAHIGRTFD